MGLTDGRPGQFINFEVHVKNTPEAVISKMQRNGWKTQTKQGNQYLRHGSRWWTRLLGMNFVSYTKWPLNAYIQPSAEGSLITVKDDLGPLAQSLTPTGKSSDESWGRSRRTLSGLGAVEKSRDEVIKFVTDASA